MAIYYLNVQIIGRSAGRSATGAAAYRAVERIVDERTGRVFDYTRRQGEIEAQIHAPAGAPDWVRERSRLWNEVERMERRGDAQVAREMVVAFPKELSAGDQRELVRSYVESQFVSQGMVADVAIHRNDGNPHAHIMLTMRKIGPEGFASTKTREWNRPEVLERWALEANRALERAGQAERIDHRSLAEQGVERLPQVHLGPHSAALERRGVATEKGDHNRVVAEHNAVVVDLEQVRSERQALVVEKTVSDRFDARIRQGWPQSYASALANLELQAGGRTLNRDELHAERVRLSQEHRNLTAEIRTMEDEGMRVRRAELAVESHGQAVEGLKRHQRPLAALRRLLNPVARSDYQHALLRVEYAEGEMKRQGVASRADLEKQRSAWQNDAARLPTLEEKARGMSDRLDTLSRAINGLDLILEPLQRVVERQRIPDRVAGPERERTRSWDRGR